MFTQDMSTHGNFERLTHLPFAPPINMKALSNVRQRTANGLANSRPFALAQTRVKTILYLTLPNTLNNVVVRANVVLALFCAVGR